MSSAHTSHQSGAPEPIHVVGAGLAGSEAAWAIANAGLRVIVHEMRPVRMTEAHQTDACAELVCSNSFRSDDWQNNAVGLLHAELRRAGSIVMHAAEAAQVPAGAALAVDRDVFSNAVTEALKAHPKIQFAREEITALPPESWANAIISTGPLTSIALAESIRAATGEDALAFFDAIAPIVHADSIDYARAWRQSRYDKEGPGGDKAAYVNCPLNEAEYDAFIAALLDAPKTEFKAWEQNTPYFEGCLPIEVMAARGKETLRFGPMKPVGLTDPNTGKRAHAVLQLRQDNKLGTLFNLVGFQTKMTYAAQDRVFRMIPGLENARFARFGGIHRNTFINAPKLLDQTLQLNTRPGLRFAGQITGVEGYVESAAMGLLAGRFASAQALSKQAIAPPPTTAMGALLAHVTGGHLSGEGAAFQPMNVNFGLFPDINTPTLTEGGKRLKGVERGKAKKRAMSARAIADFDAWLHECAA